MILTREEAFHVEAALFKSVLTAIGKGYLDVHGT